MKYYKIGSKIKVDSTTAELMTKMMMESEQAGFFFDKFTEHYNRGLKYKSLFWTTVHSKFEFPKGARLDYNSNDWVIEVMKDDPAKMELVKERDLNIKTLELQIELLKKRLDGGK